MAREIDKLLLAHPSDLAQEAAVYLTDPDTLFSFLQDCLKQSGNDYDMGWRRSYRDADEITRGIHEGRLQAAIDVYSPTLRYLAHIALDYPRPFRPEEWRVRAMFATLGRVLPYSDDLFGQNAKEIVKDVALRRAALVHADATDGRNLELAEGYLKFVTSTPYFVFGESSDGKTPTKP